MSDTMDVASLVVKRAVRELTDSVDKYLPDAHFRVNPHWNKGRKKASLDFDKTLDNLMRYLNRFSVTCLKYITPDGAYCRSVAMIDGKLTMVVFVLPFNDEFISEPFKLTHQVTNMTISRHALARWLYRNKSCDYKEGLRILGETLVLEDIKLAVMDSCENIDKMGSCEREIRCSDGGVAIVGVKDPLEDDYNEMDWTVITYLNEAMVGDWNDKAMKSQFVRGSLSKGLVVNQTFNVDNMGE